MGLSQKNAIAVVVQLKFSLVLKPAASHNYFVAPLT